MNIQAEIAAGEAFIATLPDVIRFALVGSAMYRPDAKDVDFALLVSMSEFENITNYHWKLAQHGFDMCSGADGYPEGDDDWFAARRGNLNLMVMREPVRFEKYLTAMEVCKYLKIESRDDRVAVCQIVRDGMTADMLDPKVEDLF